ncbi:hypothetical protein, partial [Klebsiella pneumoniae]
NSRIRLMMAASVSGLHRKPISGGEFTVSLDGLQHLQHTLSDRKVCVLQADFQLLNGWRVEF